ncbi:unnamed protein product, partial [Prunus brigantina]
ETHPHQPPNSPAATPTTSPTSFNLNYAPLHNNNPHRQESIGVCRRRHDQIR